MSYDPGGWLDKRPNRIREAEVALKAKFLQIHALLKTDAKRQTLGEDYQANAEQPRF